MNRRGFFTAIAAAVVAGVAIPRERAIEIVRPPIDIEVWETFEVVWTPEELARETLYAMRSFVANTREWQRELNRQFTADFERVAHIKLPQI